MQQQLRVHGVLQRAAPRHGGLVVRRLLPPLPPVLHQEVGALAGRRARRGGREWLALPRLSERLAPSPHAVPLLLRYNIIFIY